MKPIMNNENSNKSFLYVEILRNWKHVSLGVSELEFGIFYENSKYTSLTKRWALAPQPQAGAALYRLSPVAYSAYSQLPCKILD